MLGNGTRAACQRLRAEPPSLRCSTRLSPQDPSSSAPPAGRGRNRPLGAGERGSPGLGGRGAGSGTPPRLFPSLLGFRSLSSRGPVFSFPVRGALLPPPPFFVVCFFFFFFFWKGADISSFNVAQLSRLYDLKRFSLIHFNLVNMLRQVANFLGMASPCHLHIKRVGGWPHFPLCAGRRRLGRLLQGGRLDLVQEVAGRGQSQGLGPEGRGRGTRTGEGTGPSADPPLHHPEPQPALIPGRGRPLGATQARGFGEHLSPSAFIKLCLEIDGRGYRGGNRSAQLSNLLALNSE